MIHFVLQMKKNKKLHRAPAIFPPGMVELAEEHDRSLAREAKVAMEAHVRKFAGNSRDRRTAKRKATK